MTIWRREQDPEAKFPVPIVINGRCYYDEDEFSDWLSSRPRKFPRGAADEKVKTLARELRRFWTPDTRVTYTRGEMFSDRSARSC